MSIDVIKSICFLLDRDFLQTENSKFPKTISIHDLSLVYRYKPIYDPSNRLPPWKEKLENLPEEVKNYFIASWRDRILNLSSIMPNQSPIISWYLDRIYVVKNGGLPAPLLQVTNITAQPGIQNGGRIKIYQPEEVDFSYFQNRLNKWINGFLPKLIKSNKTVPMSILRSQIEVVENFLVNKEIIEQKFSSENTQEWAQKILSKSIQIRERPIPYWIVPEE